MIRSFKCKRTKELYDTGRSRKFQGIAKIALRKFDMLDAARSYEDLKIPPGNRLESLSGDRKGQHSIRINDQWRICFVWDDDRKQIGEVEIVDYH